MTKILVNIFHFQKVYSNQESQNPFTNSWPKNLKSKNRYINRELSNMYEVLPACLMPRLQIGYIYAVAIIWSFWLHRIHCSNVIKEYSGLLFQAYQCTKWIIVKNFRQNPSLDVIKDTTVLRWQKKYEDNFGQMM